MFDFARRAESESYIESCCFFLREITGCNDPVALVDVVVPGTDSRDISRLEPVCGVWELQAEQKAVKRERTETGQNRPARAGEKCQPILF
jgi:hypothetical protein